MRTRSRPSKPMFADARLDPESGAEMACLDTCVLLDLRGRGGTARQRRATAAVRHAVESGESLAVTRFTYAELWVGISRSARPDQEHLTVEASLADLEMLEFDEAAAQLYGEIMAKLLAAGKPACDMDVLIASVALVNGHSLITANRKHFESIAGLDLQSY